MQKCQNEQYLAFITGKNLIRNQQKANQLYIYRINPDHSDRNNGNSEWDLDTKVVVKDIPMFTGICLVCHFKDDQNSNIRDQMLFAKAD